MVEPGDFPDSNRTPDHRPVMAMFDLSGIPVVSKQEILAKIEKLQNDLNELKTKVEYIE